MTHTHATSYDDIELRAKVPGTGQRCERGLCKLARLAGGLLSRLAVPRLGVARLGVPPRVVPPDAVLLVAAFAAALAAVIAPGAAAHAEVFVDVGAQSSRLSSKIANEPGNIESTDAGLHLGVGVRRGMPSGRGALAVRLELDEIGSDLFLAVRPLDYRRNLSERLAWTGFFGVARLALGTPAYGWYAGGGLQVKEVLPSWDLGIDLRYGDRLARDNILPSDPKGGSPDNFHSVYGISIYLSRRF